ncbi:hypothetical protein [Streptomyces himalayensis]|uniref:hypothetical protein n=1 Tax=Streptomyces himalayensis TaxID=2820085 RepID=UPI001C6845F7|nr:hypothetical protein [Streptomyces himalayensis]
MTTAAATLPEAFRDLEPYVADWALPTRQERYDMRLSKPFEELVEFYDAIAPRAEEAIAYLDTLDLNAMPEDRHTAAAPALLAGPGLVRRERLQTAPHPRLRLGVLRHRRRAGRLTRLISGRPTV